MKVYEVNATLHGSDGELELDYEIRVMAGSGEEAIKLAKDDAKGYWDGAFEDEKDKPETYDFVLNSVKSITEVDLWVTTI